MSEPTDGDPPSTPARRSGIPGKRSILIFAGLSLALVLAVAAAYGWGSRQFTAPGPLAEAKVVVVPKGARLEVIADTLLDAGVIESGFLFEFGVRLSGKAARLRADGWIAIASLADGGAENAEAEAADDEARRLGCSHILRDGAAVGLD